MLRFARYLNHHVLQRLNLRVVRSTSLSVLENKAAAAQANAEADPNRLEAQSAALQMRTHTALTQLSDRLAAFEQRLSPRVEAALSQITRVADTAKTAANDHGAALAALAQRVETLHQKLIVPPAVPDPVGLQASILGVVRQLKPARVRGVAKMRIGNQHDGGYVMLDDLSQPTRAYSLGVGGDSSWDLELAGRGIHVVQFDHTPLALPPDHANITFVAKKIVARPEAGGIALAELEAAYGQSPASVRPILKIDIEGDEWSVLQAVNLDDLKPFAQILCEFHDFDQLANEAWRQRARDVFEKLNMAFAIIHVHGNNYRPFVTVANVACPQVLEVTFVNRALYVIEPTDELFPTPLDRPNNPHAPDLILGRLDV